MFQSLGLFLLPHILYLLSRPELSYTQVEATASLTLGIPYHNDTPPAENRKTTCELEQPGQTYIC